MLEAVVWAVAFVLVFGLAIWRADKQIDKYASAQLELKRDQQRSKEADKALSRQERQIAADLAQRTLDETAELERAEKQLKAAEARAAALVADSREIIEAKIQEEKEVIAARTEGRAIAAKEGAISRGDNTSDLDVLARTYEKYLETLAANNRLHSASSFGNWAGKYALTQSTDN